MPRESAGAPPVHVQAACGANDAAWDLFVQRHERATFFHQAGWRRVLKATFGYEDLSLIALRGEAVCGILPLFACRSIRGKLGLYSLPHTVYGGPVGDDRPVEEALIEEARRIAQEKRAVAIELRNRHRNLLDLPAYEGFVTFEKELPGTVEEVYRTFPKKAREAINQATKRHKLEADFSGDVGAFYELLASSYQKLGTPVYGRSFFGNLLREFPGASNVLIVRHEGHPVAGVLSTMFRGTMMPLYSGEAHDVLNLKANNFKYYRLMEHAVALGLRRFDFGRSRTNNEGVVTFKTNQGFQAEPLPYQRESFSGGESRPSNPNEGIFLKVRAVWRKLPPRAAKILGPKVVRYFP